MEGGNNEMKRFRVYDTCSSGIACFHLKGTESSLCDTWRGSWCFKRIPYGSMAILIQRLGDKATDLLPIVTEHLFDPCILIHSRQSVLRGSSSSNLFSPIFSISDLALVDLADP